MKPKIHLTNEHAHVRLTSKRRLAKVAALCFSTFLCGFLISEVQAQTTTYVWQSSDGDPYGLAGTIVLDAPNSPTGAYGTVSDILSISISGTTSLLASQGGTWQGSAVQSSIGLYSEGAPIPNPPFSWNPTAITQMWAAVSSSGTVGWFAGPGWNSPSQTGDGLEIIVDNVPYADLAGNWVASSVPEPNSLALLGLGVSAVAYLRRR